ncbi:dienelactone hydrolase family protein [Rhizobium sp. NZLR3b]|uniref:dienelactone hydrolase family protein n=1 Tax=Rhizobium sp. NZLR3b TaxID=2731101 RepID=UPI001C830D03|nr:dienelactone hydrolase family protein [Rhizobium sp. NZLR3b]MBX5188127.1 dienelactone hydrolase family protein [Rhizobium sp. NZLR3b]
MATVVLFHSVYGLRSLERDAAERLRAAGHQVFTPDLYTGKVARSIEEGFELKEAIGWSTLCQRAEKAVAALPGSAVLGGFSMGAGVSAHLWPKRPQMAGMLLLQGLAEIPDNARRGLPVQIHLADPDRFAPREEVEAWQAVAARSSIAAEIFKYSGAGHLYIDPTLPDHDAAAAELTWSRVIGFLAAL